jgi:hypothetical protein
LLEGRKKEVSVETMLPKQEINGEMIGWKQEIIRQTKG